MSLSLQPIILDFADSNPAAVQSQLAALNNAIATVRGWYELKLGGVTFTPLPAARIRSTIPREDYAAGDAFGKALSQIAFDWQSHVAIFIEGLPYTTVDLGGAPNTDFATTPPTEHGEIGGAVVKDGDALIAWTRGPGQPGWDENCGMLAHELWHCFGSGQHPNPAGANIEGPEWMLWPNVEFSAQGATLLRTNFGLPQTTTPLLFTGTPVNGPISSAFGAIDSAHALPHTGVDFAVPAGTAVRNRAVATVRFVSANGAPGWWWPVYGNSVILEHTDRYFTLYSHLRDAPLVSIGQQLLPDAVLGHVGMTGQATGPHLHWGLAPRENPWFQRSLQLLDPMLYVGAPPPAVPVAPNLSMLGYKGWNAVTQRFEYEYEVYQHWEGETVGPNIANEYIGYNAETGQHRYRLGILRHW